MATIDWTVPYASGSTPELLAALAPTYTLSSGTCDQPNDGITPPVPDFSAGPVPYTVEDTVNVVTNVYTVTVTVAPPPLPEFRWTGAGDGNWTDVANWNNTVPGAADIAILSDSDTAGATLPWTPTLLSPA